jgi:hypothetical protein
MQSIFLHLKSAKADFAKSVVGFHSFLLICERHTGKKQVAKSTTACRACSKNKRLAAEAKSIGGRPPRLPLVRSLPIAAALVSASSGAASVRATHDHPAAL